MSRELLARLRPGRPQSLLRGASLQQEGLTQIQLEMAVTGCRHLSGFERGRVKLIQVASFAYYALCMQHLVGENTVSICDVGRRFFLDVSTQRELREKRNESMKLQSLTTSFVAVFAIGATALAPVSGWLGIYHHPRHKQPLTASRPRTIGTVAHGSGALGVFGLLSHNGMLVHLALQGQVIALFDMSTIGRAKAVSSIDIRGYGYRNMS